MKSIGYIATTIGLMFYSAILSAFALCKMWGWFITPAFDLPGIGMTTAIGISLIVGYLTKKESVDNKNDDSYGVTLVKGFIVATKKPGFFLFTGWVVTLFM